MELRTFNKTIHIYVDVTNGSQYRDKEVPNLQEIPEDKVPENVELLKITVKTVPASVSALGADAALRFSLGRPRIIQAPGQQSNPAQEAEEMMKSMNFNELLPQTEVEYMAVAESIVDWNLTKDEQPIKPSTEVLKNLEPAWIYDYILEAYNSLNEIDEDMRRD